MDGIPWIPTCRDQTMMKRCAFATQHVLVAAFRNERWLRSQYYSSTTQLMPRSTRRSGFCTEIMCAVHTLVRCVGGIDMLRGCVCHMPADVWSDAKTCGIRYLLDSNMIRNGGLRGPTFKSTLRHPPRHFDQWHVLPGPDPWIFLLLWRTSWSHTE